MTTIKKGSKGDLAKALQYIIGTTADGIFGTKSVSALKQYQKQMGLTADGVAGNLTWSKVISNAPTLKIGATGSYVRAVECLLQTMKNDGIYSSDEFKHVVAYQTSQGIEADGIVGKITYQRLFGVVVMESDVEAKKPVDYKQYDSKWGSIVYTKNNTYNKKQTIKSSGCGITSMADIIATWWDKSITPKETASDAVSKGYRTENSGTAWSYFQYVAKKYGASKFIQTSSFATMQGCLAAGGYVVVSFAPSKWTKGGWVIVAS